MYNIYGKYCSKMEQMVFFFVGTVAAYKLISYVIVLWTAKIKGCVSFKNNTVYLFVLKQYFSA